MPIHQDVKSLYERRYELAQNLRGTSVNSLEEATKLLSAYIKKEHHIALEKFTEISSKHHPRYCVLGAVNNQTRQAVWLGYRLTNDTAYHLGAPDYELRNNRLVAKHENKIIGLQKF